ncbi:hypothetical protein V2G26_016992 [Clonostachys chloroleuca]
MGDTATTVPPTESITAADHSIYRQPKRYGQSLSAATWTLAQASSWLLRLGTRARFEGQLPIPARKLTIFQTERSNADNKETIGDSGQRDLRAYDPLSWVPA